MEEASALTEAKPTSQGSAPIPRPIDTRAIVRAGLAASLLAVAVAFAYYNDPWRPIAHTLGPWAVLATAVAFRQRLKLALVISITSLAVAVVVFYVSLKIGHDIRWAGTGSSMGIPWSEIQLWLVLALIAGAAFGLLGSNAGRHDWRGPVATACLIGLLIGEVYRRFASWGLDISVVLDSMLVVVVAVVGILANRRPWVTLAISLIAAAAGFMAAGAPDFIQQRLIEGF